MAFKVLVKETEMSAENFLVFWYLILPFSFESAPEVPALPVREVVVSN